MIVQGVAAYRASVGVGFGWNGMAVFRNSWSRASSSLLNRARSSLRSPLGSAFSSVASSVLSTLDCRDGRSDSLIIRSARDTGRTVKHTQALFACTEREAREAIALNYGSIKCIDDGIARVMAQLRDSGMDRNTVVIFTSDHGDFMGDHQILLKGPVHYRGLIRVPFIWCDPEVRKQVKSKALTQTTDIAPTRARRSLTRMSPRASGISPRSSSAM